MSLSSIRPAARVTSLHGKITLCDNLPALCSFERGRSSSSRLNRICQQAAAYQIRTGIRWRLRHIESLRNPADKDSRFHQIAKQELRRPNRPVVSPLVERGFAPGLAVDSASQELGREGDSFWSFLQAQPGSPVPYMSRNVQCLGVLISVTDLIMTCEDARLSLSFCTG